MGCGGRMEEGALGNLFFYAADPVAFPKNIKSTQSGQEKLCHLDSISLCSFFLRPKSFWLKNKKMQLLSKNAPSHHEYLYH
jgi:hypothetical protein